MYGGAGVAMAAGVVEVVLHGSVTVMVDGVSHAVHSLVETV